ncbi:unnamed protein product [Hermetia illucens]|uniref:IGFBP N-terminal domain-containing protein n=2 Tax=Hermetia illucens TaxID=343691 RepID=A0A7R8UIC5_HERIL|nr:unnamed protein product [Hermetia illucens]
MIAVSVSNHSTVNALRCYCNPQECDVIRSQDCPGKGFTVWDPCKCCRMCARTLGEACGGPGGFSGTCEPPLQCVAQLPLVDGLGVCMDLPESTSTTILNCTNEETIVLDAGCEITNNKCQCWPVIKICKENRPSSGRWHFRTLEDCQLNLQNLIKTEMEFDEDFTVSPRSFTYRKVRGKRRRVRKR